MVTDSGHLGFPCTGYGAECCWDTGQQVPYVPGKCEVARPGLVVLDIFSCGLEPFILEEKVFRFLLFVCF